MLGHRRLLRERLRLAFTSGIAAPLSYTLVQEDRRKASTEYKSLEPAKQYGKKQRWSATRAHKSCKTTPKNKDKCIESCSEVYNSGPGVSVYDTTAWQCKREAEGAQM